MHNTLRGKKILVTAGPTWVSIDPVRVISNISTGLTGAIIARYAADNGADVTLLLGPALFENAKLSAEPSRRGKLKIIRFKYFDELQKLIHRRLSGQKYDIIVQAAAVSDYRPSKISEQKIRSGRKSLSIFLKPTVKLIGQIRKAAPRSFLVMFKLEAGKPKERLIEIARQNMFRSKADLIVANNLEGVAENRHRAYIIDCGGKITVANTKNELAKNLFSVISEKLQNRNGR